ncbi:MAG: hypothetical protein IKU43_07110 [Clostridia bacterium]|nr:hypothetical protein [Clostridia bacterium]
MCYIITDNVHYLGMDYRGRPSVETKSSEAHEFMSWIGAENFLRCLPDAFRRYKWEIVDLRQCEEEGTVTVDESGKRIFGNSTKTTILEADDFDICNFFDKVITVMSQLDRYIANMKDGEQLTDMKILDVRHYIRNNNHRLNAIQMQRLGYYLQELERKRYGYKSGRLIAEMFASNVEALKDKSCIDKMNDIVNSRYHPRVLEDSDIESIINKKKELEFPTDAFATYGEAVGMGIG